MEKMNEYRKNFWNAHGELCYHLEVFGDFLAEREGYGRHTGMDAVWFYLIQKYKWLPRDVKTMSEGDIRFVLEEEMIEWHLPADAK